MIIKMIKTLRHQMLTSLQLLTKLIFLTFTLYSLTTALAHAKGKRSKGIKRGMVGVAGSAGAPELASLQIRYKYLNIVGFNVGYGSFGLRKIVEDYGNFKISDLEKDLTTNLRFVPTLEAGLISSYAAARIYPFMGGLYGQVRFTQWKFWAHSTAAIINHSNDSNMALGSLTVILDQNMYGGNIGYEFEFMITSRIGVFFDTGIGYQLLSDPKSEIKLGGKLKDWTAFAASLDPAIKQKMDDAKTEVIEKINSEAKRQRDRFSVLPLFYMTVGINWKVKK